MSAADVRTWAAERGLDCPSRVRIPSSIEQAYNDAHQPELGEPPMPPEPVFTVPVSIPGVDQEVTDEIAGHLLEAVWSAFHAGRDTARAEILTHLGAS